MASFYLPSSEQVYTDADLYVNTGLHPTDDPGVLASNGVYTVNETPDPYDLNLYTTVAVYTISGDYADQSWAATPLPLATAQENAVVEVKEQANDAIGVVLSDNSVSGEVMTSVAGQLLADRPAELQTVLAEMQAVTDNLGTQLTDIAACTTVDEVNNIVNPPTGIINIGRGQFGGPYDLNASNYVVFNSVSMTEAETELYAPSTSSVVPYQGYPPDDFNSGGPIFVSGDYLIQIRETATGRVIAEFEVPLSTDGSNENITF